MIIITAFIHAIIRKREKQFEAECAMGIYKITKLIMMEQTNLYI